MKRIVPTLLFIGALSAAGPGHAGDMAVIVNKSNRLSALSLENLVRFSRMDRQFWPDGVRVYLVLPEAGSPEKRILLRHVYQMNGEGLKKLWVTKIFRGEIASFPKTLSSNEAVLRFVAKA